MDDRIGREPRPRRRRYDDEYDYEYEDYPRRRPYPPRPRPRPRRRRRRVWPTLLIGCLLGMLVAVLVAAGVVVFTAYRFSQGSGITIGPVGNSPHTFTHQDTTQVDLSTLSQIQICDKIGNIAVKVDPNATMATVTSTKIVHKNSQSDADQEFGRIAVEVQPPGTITNPLTCTRPQVMPTASSSPAASATATTTTTATGTPNSALTINVTQPISDSFLSSSDDAVDLSLTLPQKVLPQEVTSMLLDIEAPVGNITVDGVSGLLQVNGGTGNVTVSHAVLAPGSQIATAQGNVTFNGWLLPPDPPDTNARYVLQSEKGDIDVTLPDNTNVTLDANTNVGAVHSEFPITVDNNGGPVNYHGPLNSNASSQPVATLYLDVSTGNITLHKTQA